MQEVDTLVQYVISPIWTYFANLKSEKWNLATIFLFLLIPFQDVSFHTSKIYFDMVWITNRNIIWYSKIMFQFFLTNLDIFFWKKYCPLCHTYPNFISYCYGDNENRALQCKGKVQFLVTSISARYRTGRTHILP